MVSTPHVANANKMEKTATITIKLEDSAREGNVTLCLSSSMDSFIYVNMSRFLISESGTLIDSFHLLFIRSNCAREERLELPTPGFGDQCSTN